jgi:hypothetical protein
MTAKTDAELYFKLIDCELANRCFFIFTFTLGNLNLHFHLPYTKKTELKCRITYSISHGFILKHIPLFSLHPDFTMHQDKEQYCNKQ